MGKDVEHFFMCLLAIYIRKKNFYEIGSVQQRISDGDFGWQ
jgi:hypothetical protein